MLKVIIVTLVAGCSAPSFYAALRGLRNVYKNWRKQTLGDNTNLVCACSATLCLWFAAISVAVPLVVWLVL